MPAWLGERAMWDTETATDPMGNYFKAQEQGLAVKQSHLNLASSVLGLEQQHQAIDINAFKLKQSADEQAAWNQDAPTVVPWLLAPPDKRKTMPTPAYLRSDKAIQAVQEAQKTDELYDLKKQTEQQRIDAAKIAADQRQQVIDLNKRKLEAQSARWNDQSRIEEMRVEAQKNGRSSEFMQVQADYDAKIAARDNPEAQLTPEQFDYLTQSAQRDLERMTKLTTFAPKETGSTTTTMTDPNDPNKKVSVVKKQYSSTDKTSTPVKPAAKQAMGGYEINAVYNGMTYLGGDPNDEKNWRK